MDDKTLLASSGEGTVQSFDLRYRKPDIQSEVMGCSKQYAVQNHMVRPVGGHGGTFVGEHQITRLVDCHKKG